MRRPRQRIVATLALLAAGMASGQTYYKWTDAHGTTHYSEQAPEVAARKVKVSAPSTVPAVTASTETSPAAASSVLDSAKSAFRKQACATGRNNFALLSSRAMVLDTGSLTNPAGIGDATKLSPEQRSAAKVAAQEQIHDYCDQR